MNGNKNIYKVPEGYFDSLKTRLEAISALEQRELPEISLWQRIQPYAALAACFVMALAVGTLFLGNPSVKSTDAELQDYYYSHLYSVEDPMALYYEDYETDLDSVSDEDILEYLISTGATTNYVSYMLNQ